MRRKHGTSLPVEEKRREEEKKSVRYNSKRKKDHSVIGAMSVEHTISEGFNPGGTYVITQQFTTVPTAPKLVRSMFTLAVVPEAGRVMGTLLATAAPPQETGDTEHCA